MADVRCPMCGLNNPAELDICKFCGARLKPVLPSVPPRPIHAGEAPVEKGTSELDKAALGQTNKEAIRPGEAPTKKDTGELERALPSWLRDLREQGIPPTSGEPSVSSEDQSPPPEASPSSSQEARTKKHDWLSGLGTSSEDKEEIPDWLASIRSKTEDKPAVPQEPEEELPAGLQGDEWLSRLGEQKSQEEPPPPASQEPAGTPTEGFPDWLSGVKAESTAPAPEPTPGGEVSDFLAGFRKHEPEEPLPTPPAEAAPEAFPEWFSKLKEETEKPEDTAAAIPAEMPDWLTGLKEETSQPEGGIPTPDTASSELPDWLARPQEEAAQPEGEPDIQAAAPGELPDWLSMLKPSEPAAEHEKPAAVTPFDEPVKEERPEEGLIPDWLTAAGQPGAEPGGPPPLTSREETPAQSSKPGGMFTMETPEWLSTLKPEEGKETPALQPAREETPEALPPVDLPSWVQAMRPVESVVEEVTLPELEEELIPESAGPLAGLRGVLPAAPGLGPLRKPPAYSVMLQVTESQQRHVAHLERIVSTESEPRPIKTAPLLSSARLLRWILALILLFAAGLPLVSGIQVVPTNMPYPPEMVSMMNLIGGLPAGSPVLVAFDYEPALSGELEATAAPVIDHLLFTGARLSILSTSPTGAALAERFLRNTQAGHDYQAGQQYINLGYLAGGPAGVLGFVQNPVSAAPYSVDGSPAWQTPPLEGIQKLGDFSLIIILTDNADTGRIWIEQSASYLGNTPLAMVISAQAEPMIRPYYDSGQIKGLVTGLAGGKAYEQALQRPGLGGAYWNAFSAGLLVAVIVIIIGAVWSAISALHARRNQPGKEA